MYSARSVFRKADKTLVTPNDQTSGGRPQPFFALVDALAMVKVAEMGDTAASEANHVRAGRIQRWAAFLSKFNAIVVHVPGDIILLTPLTDQRVATKHTPLRAVWPWRRVKKADPARAHTL